MKSGNKEIDVLRTFEFSLGNPISHHLISYLSRKEGGKSPLEEALSGYCGEAKIPGARKLGTLPIWILLEMGRLAFHVDKNIMRDYFKDPIARRGLLNVMKSIGDYGVTRPSRLSAPFLVVWNYTNACNLRCVHCYQNAGRPLGDELTLEEKLEVVDQLAENNVAALAFSGGEPLMGRDFWEVARYAASKKMYVSVATNGTLLTEDTVKKLVEVGVGYLEISLDAATPEIHNAFRGSEDAWQRTMQGIRNAVKEKSLFVCIASTITRHNYEELEQLVELAKKLGAQRFLAFNFIPTGKGKDALEIDLSPQMRENMLRTLFKYLKEGKVEVMTTAPQFARICMMNSRDTFSMAHFGAGRMDERTRTIAEFIGGCGAGRMYCAIQPNGIMTPCVYIPVKVGDLRKEKFINIWRNSEILNTLRDRWNLKENCGKCNYKNVCGGCRARAYAYYGDLEECDPGCINNLKKSLNLGDLLIVGEELANPLT